MWLRGGWHTRSTCDRVRFRWYSYSKKPILAHLWCECENVTFLLDLSHSYVVKVIYFLIKFDRNRTRLKQIAMQEKRRLSCFILVENSLFASSISIAKYFLFGSCGSLPRRTSEESITESIQENIGRWRYWYEIMKWHIEDFIIINKIWHFLSRKTYHVHF
jgi:hypothetical protein